MSWGGGGVFTHVAHSKCLIDVVLKFRMRQLDMSGYYLRAVVEFSLELGCRF